MFSTFKYVKIQLKNKFIAHPVQSILIYLSPIIFFLIAWIFGKFALEKEESGKIVNGQFMYILIVTLHLYIILCFTSAYDLIQEKALYRKQYMYTYGFHLIKFYFAWFILYMLLILPTSIIITLCIYFLNILPNIHIVIIFGSFLAYELMVVTVSFWFSAYFSKPVIGAIFCVFVSLCITISQIATTYFDYYRTNDDNIDKNRITGYVNIILYRMKLAEHKGQFINFSTIFNDNYQWIFIDSCSNLVSVLLYILFGIFSDYLIISTHIIRHWYERRNHSKYRSFFPKSFSKFSKKFSKKASKVTANWECNSETDSETGLNSNNDKRKSGWRKKYLSFRKSRNLQELTNINYEIDIGDGSSLNLKDDEDLAVFGENLFKQYSSNGQLILQNVTFYAYKNEVLVVVGPCHAGKSTLMRILYGRHSSSFGRVKIYDKDLDYSGWDSVTGKLSVAPREDYVFFRDLTVADHIYFYESLISFRNMDQEHGYDLLKEFNFTRNYNTPVKDLKKDERIKLKIILALLKPTDIIFLEEPVDYLSSEDCIVFWRMIDKRRSRKTIIISTTDKSDDTLNMADRIIVLDHHQIQCAGGPNEIRKYFQTCS